MTEALDKAKKVLGLDQPGEKEGTKEGKEPTIWELIEKLDDMDARELLRARVRELTTAAELRAKQKEREIKLVESGRDRVEGLPGNQTGEGSVNKEVTKWTVRNGKPVKDPEGEYDTFAQACRVAEIETSKRGDGKDNTLALILKLQELGIIGGKTGSKNDTLSDRLATAYLDGLEARATGKGGGAGSDMAAVRAEIATMREEIEKGNSPIEVARKHKAFIDAYQEVGLLPTETDRKKSVEELHEENRHAEEKERNAIERKHKEDLVEVLADVPPLLSEAVAAWLDERGGGEEKKSAAKKTGAFPTVPCPNCGRDVSIPPKHGPTIRCGGCGKDWEIEEVPTGEK